MALTLHLLRHAKSSWKEPGPDHDRPLNARGRGAADAIGDFLAREGPAPGRVLCSSAARTQETWRRVEERLGTEPELVVDPDLYLAPASEMLERIREAGGDTPCVLLVAHNPGTEDLARWLAGSGDEAAWHRLRQKYPTGGLTTLRFDASAWDALKPGAGELLRFVVPREL